MEAQRWEIKRGSEGYPALLEELGDDAPETLYGIGDQECLGELSISIIGARKATPYGTAIARMAGRIAAECSLAVVSGGAMGCDSAAARGSLNAGGRTIVVSATGADLVYPARSRDVFEKAPAEGGAVISEQPWGTPPRRFAFVRRNRIIAALSPSLIVTEAGLKSGTASTADAAAKLGRRVYSIPGSIFSPNSAFTNKLIADGATIITTEQDLEVQISLDYGLLRMTPVEGGKGFHGSRLLSALMAQPMRVDDLAASYGESVLTIMKELSQYELQGIVERLPDGRMSLTEEAYETHARMRQAKY